MDGHGSHLTIEFLWECKQNRVYLVFLPAHASHVLQPLDLACFSVVKSKYRKQIADLSYLDDAAPVKKRRFVRCYNLAREEGLSPRVIRGGWNAAGLYPWNPKKVLQSSQVKNQRKDPTENAEKTEKLPEETAAMLYATPKRPQQVYEAIVSLNSQLELARDCRVVLQKNMKAIGKLNAEKASLEMVIQSQAAKIANLEAKKPKKKVAEDPNSRFINIDAIRKAQEELAIQEQRRKEREPIVEARKLADQMAKANMQEFMHEWQLE